MRTRHHASLFLLGILCVLALPLDPSAAVSTNASAVPACQVADAPPPPVPRGDEDFFTVPGGSISNVMLLLDDSGSMADFPRSINWQYVNTRVAATQGTCSAIATPFVGLNTPVTLSATPYDNGWTTGDGRMVDNPPWGLSRCEAKQAEPTGDHVFDYCLYRPTSKYKFTTGTTGQAGDFWRNAGAYVYNTHPCAAVNNDGSLLYDASGNLVSADEDSCNACLNSVGWYMFRPYYRSSSTSYRYGQVQLVFTGKFLNAYPQKFIIARKVVKDLVKMDQNVVSGADGVRFGLTVFSGGGSGGTSSYIRSGDGGRLVVPVGPDCDNAYPLSSHKGNYQTARQTIVDAVNAVDSTGQDGSYLTFDTMTPLAETLFNIGQYFNSTGTSSPYSTMWGQLWTLPRPRVTIGWTTYAADTRDFTEKSAGLVNASWASNSSQASVCWACQQSSVVLVTDGMPTNDENLPATCTTTSHSALRYSSSCYDFRYWSNSTINCSNCGGALLPKMAYFLSQTDLRADLANTAGSQVVNTYTISFGITDSTALAVLQKTAQLGGGTFANTSSGEELSSALSTAVTDVVNRAVSFSSSSSSSLQTAVSTTADAYLARFKPNSSNWWEGHLFAGMVFDEFGEGCNSTRTNDNQTLVKTCGTASDVNPNLNEDKDANGLAICKSAYIVDQDCAPIVEDATGTFKKGYFDANGNLLGGTDNASMYWDAGYVLSTPTDADSNAVPGYRSADESAANKRLIYTVIDTGADGQVTSTDGKLNGTDQLTEFTRANAAKLAPYMSLDQSWCETMEAKAGICGGAGTPACPAWDDTARANCAKMVVDYLRGYDVLDEDGDHCGGPDDYENTHGYGSCTTTNVATACGTTAATCTSGQCFHTACSAGEQRDRANDSRAASAQSFWKLGDIFHSSPILVKPPASMPECDTGLINQCTYALYTKAANGGPTFANYTLGTASVSAYVKWRSENLNRQRIILVGGNDAMLHAFDAGSADTSKPANAEGQYPVTNGTGAELWAFIPPDLLPRLKYALAEHTYYVDGTTMVRDIWTDLNNDGQKTKDEFKTVAILSERGGGTHFTALDVTNVAAPKFLWTFPKPGTEEARLVGQSWTDFAPGPPPIGPVKLAKGSTNFEERWVAFLNGGYDPAMVRGRGLWMVDAYTGKVLWRYTDADFVAMRGNGTAHMGPVPASPAISDIGLAQDTIGSVGADGYFDTATFGDVFGNLYVARFYAPGTVSGTTGLVTNWTASRSFEMNRKSDDTQVMTKRSQFFFQPTNLLDPPNRLVTVIGSGNRQRLMDSVPKCSPDDLLGCCKAGCSVASATTTATYGYGCSMGGTFQCSNGSITYTSNESSSCTTGPTTTCGTSTQTVTFNFTCGGTSYGPVTGTLTCDANGTCTTDDAPGSTQAATSSLTSCPNHDCMFGIWSYGQNTSKVFDETLTDQTATSSARTFDKNRFTDVSYTGTCGTFSSCSLIDTSSALTQTSGQRLTTTCQDTGVTKCVATAADPGWKYCYGNYCPTNSCSTSTPWCDELTGSAVSGGYSACVQFYSFRPTSTSGTTVSTDPCNSQDIGSLTATSYLTDAITGTTSDTCGYHVTNTSGTSTTHYRAETSQVASAPKTSTLRVVVNPGGEVNYGVLGDSSAGGNKTSFGSRSSTTEQLYQLAVPPASHSCRHTPPPTDPTKARKCE